MFVEAEFLTCSSPTALLGLAAFLDLFSSEAPAEEEEDCGGLEPVAETKSSGGDRSVMSDANMSSEGDEEVLEVPEPLRPGLDRRNLFSNFRDFDSVIIY